MRGNWLTASKPDDHLAYSAGTGYWEVRETAVRCAARSGPTAPPPVPLGLDFVYGTPDQAALVILDGQQRLTTLFLLH